MKFNQTQREYHAIRRATRALQLAEIYERNKFHPKVHRLNFAGLERQLIRGTLKLDNDGFACCE